MNHLADFIIEPRWIIPIKPRHLILEQYAIAVQASKILAIEPIDTIRQHYTTEKWIKLPSHAVLPGFINCHTHTAMSLFRGLADDLQLMPWLKEYIWPAERKWLSQSFIRTGTQLAMAEMIRSGTTCFNDMYFFPETAAQAVSAAQMRACLGVTVMSVPSEWAQTPEEYISKGIPFIERYQKHTTITPTLAPHSIYTADQKVLLRIRELAEDYGLLINIHLQETLDEIENSLKYHSKRPIPYLYDLGLLSNRLLAVHMTHLDNQDMNIIAKSKTNIVHCPESNMKLSSGYCQTTKCLQRGINVTLGTDGAASNNDLDMLGEMRTAGLLAKHEERNPTALPVQDLLEMATINGANALGLSHKIGSLEANKEADIIAIDLSHLNTLPLYNPLSHLVYAAKSHQVTDVWIAGNHILKNHQLMTIDEQVLRKEVYEWQQKIKNI